MMGRCGDNYTKLRRHWLERLMYVTRVADHRLPSICLVGWLPQV